AELIFRDRKALADRRYSCGGIIQGSSSAGSFQTGSSPAFESLAENSQALTERVGCLDGDFHLLIQFQQFEICGCDIAQKAQPHTSARFVGGEKTGASRFIEPAHSAPEVHFPEGVQTGGDRTDRGPTIRKRRAEHIIPPATNHTAVVDVGDKL